MNLALCYESVLPARGGCETYIADLSRRLAADGHQVHLYACRWDDNALPAEMHYHRLTVPGGPRFLRPWLFGAACLRALRGSDHDVSVGFDKAWGLDVLYPQGGLHVASADHNLRKHRLPPRRWLARFAKQLDLAHWSYALLERRQYLGAKRPLVVVNSHMVRRHFEQYYGYDPDDLRVVYSAIDPDRFVEDDRPRQRLEWRQRWGIAPEETVGLFVAMNYRLKGLEPLLYAVRDVPGRHPFRLVIAGNPKTARYERLARRLGVASRVRFVGYCAQARDCYFGSDFLVHPTFYDPCSLVVLEALACGLPVITSRFNGAGELLTVGENGFVLDTPHDVSALASCITQLLDGGKRKRFTQAARRAGAEWTFEQHYRQLLLVFGEAAARKQAA